MDNQKGLCILIGNDLLWLFILTPHLMCFLIIEAVFPLGPTLVIIYRNCPCICSHDSLFIMSNLVRSRTIYLKLQPCYLTFFFYICQLLTLVAQKVFMTYCGFLLAKYLFQFFKFSFYFLVNVAVLCTFTITSCDQDYSTSHLCIWSTSRSNKGGQLWSSQCS